MLTLIRWLLRRRRKKKGPTPQQEIDALLAELRRESRDSLSGALAVTVQAKKALDTTRIVDVPFPEDILNGDVPLDDEALRRLDAYAREMRRFQRACLAQGTNLTASVARGLDIWTISFWTLAQSQAEKGREIWRLLMQGEPNLEPAYKFMVRRDLTDVELSYLTYRPRILLDA